MQRQRFGSITGDPKLNVVERVIERLEQNP
jgi:hypothetical protein